MRQRILWECHDIPSVGHVGIRRTLELLERSYHWRSRKDATQYIQTCPICQMIKPDTRKKAGALQPVPPPERKWNQVTTWRGFGDSRAIRPLRRPMRPEWASSARMRRAVSGRSVVRSAQCGPRPADGRARGGCARSGCATRLRPAGAVAGDASGREKECYSQTTTGHHSCGCQCTDHMTMRPYGPAIVSHPPIRYGRGTLSTTYVSINISSTANPMEVIQRPIRS